MCSLALSHQCSRKQWYWSTGKTTSWRKKWYVCVTFPCHIECVWCETLHFLSYPILLFSCNARPTLVRRSLMAIRTPSSSAGSSRSRRCRSDWEILQVRGRHAAKLSPTNHSQSTSTKSFSFHIPLSPFALPTHPHIFWRFYSASTPLISLWNHKPYTDRMIKGLSFISRLS